MNLNNKGSCTQEVFQLHFSVVSLTSDGATACFCFKTTQLPAKASGSFVLQSAMINYGDCVLDCECCQIAVDLKLTPVSEHMED